MALSRRRPGSTPDPARQNLIEVRRGLMRLHKSLIDSERRAFERVRGPQTSGQLLQALIQDPFFEWLKPFSSLLVEIDEVLSGDDPITPQLSRGYVEQVRALVEPGDPEAEQNARYERIYQHDPDVLVAHVELTRRISDALE